jgi:hypothetical protein
MAFVVIDSNGYASGLPAVLVYDVHGRLKVKGGGPTPPGSTVWGTITGTVTNQTDLINYLGLNFYPLSSNPAGYLTDAPSDGSTYGRNNGAWTVVTGGTTPTLQQVVNAGNGITNFGGTGNASIQSTNFTNNRTLILNDNAYPTIRLVDNLNAANYLQIDIDTLNIDGVSYNWSSIVAGGVTPAALTKTDDTNVTLTLGGTPATALLQATSLTLGWTGTLATGRGGTGLSAIGSGLQYLRVNSGATGLEYATFPTIPAQYNPTAGTGISITGAYPNQTISNTLPDQTVVLTAGTGIGIAGTYPSFTISNSDPTSGVTLTSAGGTETLVNDGTGPSLATKGLSASTGISLSSNATAVTITNSAPDQVVSLGTTGTGFSVTGSYPSFTLQNTLPDQTVVLNSGTGISVTGTYPTFTITNTATTTGDSLSPFLLMGG